MMGHYRGHISNRSTVWCGRCAEWMDIAERPSTTYARRMGWVLTRAFGWLCPACDRKSLDKKLDALAQEASHDRN